MPLALDKRIWNLAWLPIRTTWTVLYWWLDAINTVVTLPKQALEIVSNTTGQIKDVFNNAWNTWKRYNKLVNVPLCPFIATGTAIEWAVRAVVNPTWNAVTHTRDVVWNTFVNVWNSIKWTLSDKPVSDFKYEHLKTNPIGTKNYISKRQWLSSWAKKTPEVKEEKKPEAKKDDKPEAKKDDKPKDEIKWADEESKSRISKLEEANNKIMSILQTMQAQQAETNKKLFDLLSDKKWNNAPGEKPWKKIGINRKNVDNDQDTNENQWREAA